MHRVDAGDPEKHAALSPPLNMDPVSKMIGQWKDDGTGGRCSPFDLPFIVCDVCRFVHVITVHFYFLQA